MSGYASFYCKPACGKHVDTAVRLEPEARCALCLREPELQV